MPVGAEQPAEEMNIQAINRIILAFFIIKHSLYEKNDIWESAMGRVIE